MGRHLHLRDLDEPKVDWLLRDIMQSTESLSFICAGSQPSIIHAMVEEDAAFYRFFTPGPAFGPIDADHLTSWIAHRMTTKGVRCPREVAAHILREVRDRTQDILLLAQETFQLARPAGEASVETVEAALASVVAREADRFRATWDRLTRNQKLVVRALAGGVEDPFAHGSIPELPGSSVQRASAVAASTSGIRGDAADGDRTPVPARRVVCSIRRRGGPRAEILRRAGHPGGRLRSPGRPGKRQRPCWRLRARAGPARAFRSGLSRHIVESGGGRLVERR